MPRRRANAAAFRLPVATGGYRLRPIPAQKRST